MEIIPYDRSHDTDAIADFFLVAQGSGRNKNKVFKAKPGGLEVQFDIPWDVYQAALKHKNREEEGMVRVQ